MSTTTVMYVDLDRSIRILDEMGEMAYASLFNSHVASIRRAVGSQRSRIDKVLEDGVLVHFDSTYSAIRAARSIQQLVEKSERDYRSTLKVRIGMAVGEVVETDDETYGATLMLARRLCRSAARPGDILVSDLVRALLASRGDIEFEPFDCAHVEGIEQPLVAWRVPWSPLPAAERLRVIVADDATLIRSGIVHLLRDCGFEVTAEAADAQELIAAVEADPPDLVITDIRMPPTNTDDGLRAAKTIRKHRPDVAVLVLSQYVEAPRAAELLDNGSAGIGYLLKERVSDIDEFLEACRSVAAGGSIIDPTIGERLLDARRSTSQLASLSQRERDALALMARGRSNQAIANDLCVSGKTVETYVRSIFQKLDLAETADDHRRVRAVLAWLGETRTAQDG